MNIAPHGVVELGFAVERPDQLFLTVETFSLDGVSTVTFPLDREQVESLRDGLNRFLDGSIYT